MGFHSSDWFAVLDIGDLSDAEIDVLQAADRKIGGGVKVAVPDPAISYEVLESLSWDKHATLCTLIILKGMSRRAALAEILNAQQAAA